MLVNEFIYFIIKTRKCLVSRISGHPINLQKIILEGRLRKMRIVTNLALFAVGFLPRGVKKCELGIMITDIGNNISAGKFTFDPINKNVVNQGSRVVVNSSRQLLGHLL